MKNKTESGNKVLMEGLSEGGAFEQRPKDMRQGIPGRKNRKLKVPQDASCLI